MPEEAAHAIERLRQPEHVPNDGAFELRLAARRLLADHRLLQVTVDALIGVQFRAVTMPRYARMTRQVEARIGSAYLAGTDTRRVERALGALFRGAVGKDAVSRTWRRVKDD